MDLYTVLGTFFALLILVPLIKRWIRWQKFVNTVDKIPGYKKIPILGNTFRYKGLPRTELFNKFVVDRYYDFPGGISRQWMFYFPEIRLNRAEYVEKLLSSQKNITKGLGYELDVKRWLGEGLVTSTDHTWFVHRKLITPAFHFSILEGFCDVFAEKIDQMVEKLRKFSETGEVVDVYPILSLTALDIICETAMGIKVDTENNSEFEYIKAVSKLFQLAFKRYLNPLMHNLFLFNLTSDGKEMTKTLKTLHNYTDKVIAERKLSRKKALQEKVEETDEFGRKKRLAFLDLLLEEAEKSNAFTDKDIREETDTFIFAGHDTTTVTTAWALFLLGHHPDVQEKLYAEQKEIFGEKDLKRLPTYKDLGKMLYMERVMKECIRIYPTFVNVSRRVTEEFEIDGYTIPVGATVAIGIWGCTRDERFFPDPEKFDPDRWLPENTKNHHPYAHIPFSAGPRNCIGQKFAKLEEKTMLSCMIRNYKFKSVDSRKDIKIISEIVARPHPGVRLILEQRKE